MLSKTYQFVLHMSLFLCVHTSYTPNICVYIYLLVMDAALKWIHFCLIKTKHDLLQSRHSWVWLLLGCNEHIPSFKMSQKSASKSIFWPSYGILHEKGAFSHKSDPKMTWLWCLYLFYWMVRSIKQTHFEVSLVIYNLMLSKKTMQVCFILSYNEIHLQQFQVMWNTTYWCWSDSIQLPQNAHTDIGSAGGTQRSRPMCITN